MALIPVILSGGVGARLWPVSRELHPKPFMRLSDGQSLLQKAFLRAAGLPAVAEVLTVTNRELYFKTEDEYRGVNETVPASFILEPFGRNTAPAIAAAALYAAQTHGDDAILLILPADHLISKQDAFAESVATAVQLAREGSVVTFGIKPHAPETGFGYIETEGKHGVKRFVEKPDLARAKEYVSAGRYLWNAGMFCFSAGVLLNELEAHAPDVLSAVRGCIAASDVAKKTDSTQIELNADAFRKAPDISIDYALMERSSRVAVVACDIGWSDIGSWSAVSELVPSDEHGNAALGEVLFHDSSNCYIQSDGRVAAGIGIKDLIVIDTPDALLVVDRARVQDVKHVVGQLKARAHDAYKVHREVHRPWGTYTVLEEGKRFKIKRIVVKPGASLSLQMHHHRSEHWIVVSGMAKVVNGEKEFFVNTNESTYIPAGHRHRLVNPGMIELVMIEVQSGEYLGEDDIVRFQDHYGRT